MAEPRIQYAKTSDGVNIAYAVSGSGPPLLGVSQTWSSHLSKALTVDMNREAIEEAEAHFTLVRYDGRGSGLSDRDALDFSLEARTRDLEAVVARVGLDTFYLRGIGHGCLAAVAYAAGHPERVVRLALINPYASGELLYRESPLMRVVASLASEAEGQWQFVATTIATREFGEGNPRIPQYVELMRAAMEPRAFLAFTAANQRIDVTDLLPRIAAETLIVHIDMEFAQISYSRAFATSIPRAELITFERAALSAYRLSARPTLEFFGATLAPAPTAPAKVSGTATILFTDIVGHTEMMQRLGDAKGRDVLREHERITRDVLRRHGGIEVKTDGDSFMASFGSVSSAVECAVALQRAFAEYSATADEPIVVRMGLNVGEPIEEDGDLFGSAVILAARIKEQAAGGEILVPEAVRHMLSGKSFVFADRGAFELKGFADAVRLYEVRWRE